MNGTESLSCTLVVPCHNERERLDPEAFRAAERGFPWLRLLFVADGSTDGTAELLQGFRVLRLDRRQGKAGTVRAGILEALSSSRPGGLVGFLDADLATPLADVAGLCLALAGRPGVAAAFGSRWRHLGGAIKRRPLRALSGAAMATAIRLATGLPVYDSQCGAKVFRAEAARVQSLIRRATRQREPTILRVGDLTLDRIARKVSRAGQANELQRLEFLLLEYLMRNVGRVVSKSTIIEHVWGYDFAPGTNVVEARVCRLREKIDHALAQKHIRTVKGFGYVLE